MTGPVYQQDLEARAGIDERILCAPAALLYVASEKGYDIEPQALIDGLDWGHWEGRGAGWSRAGLTQMLREQYHVSSVSWWTTSTGSRFSDTDLERMHDAGYVYSPEETSFLQSIVSKLPQGTDGIFALVTNGYHVVVTAKPGFGANQAQHAIVLLDYDAEQSALTIFDPDARNTTTIYKEAFIRKSLSPTGACTIIL